MAEYQVTTSSGEVFRVTAPDELSPQEVNDYVTQNLPTGVEPTGSATGIESRTPGPRSSVYQAGTRMPTAGRALLNASQGPFMNFADEIAGAGAAAIDKVTGRNPGVSFNDLRQGYTDFARGASDSFGKERPWTSTGAQILASLPLAAGAAPMRPGATMLQRGVQAARVGAGYGAVNAAGATNDLTDPSNAIHAIGLGAALGGVTGPLANAVGGATGAVVGNLASRFNSSTAKGFARSRVANALLRDMANEKDFGGNAISAAQARLTNLGPQARVADLGQGNGQNTRALLDTVTTLPGATKNQASNAIRERVSTRGNRLFEAADEATGAGGRRLYSTLDDLMTERSAASAAPYDAVRAMTVPRSPALDDLLATAQRQGLFKEAKAIADFDGKAFTLKPGSSDYSMSDLHFLKIAVDNRKGSAAGTKDGKITPYGRSVDDFRSRLLDQLDTATDGAYKVARDAYAGPSALMDAAKLGRTVMNNNVPPAQIRSEISKMSESERDAFYVGVNEALRSKAGTPNGQSELMSLFKNQNLQERLKAAFPDERTYRQFASRIAAEERLAKIGGVGTGSPTASRQMAIADEGAAVLDAATDIASAKAGNPAAAVSLVRKLYGGAVLPEPVRDEMGKLLLKKGPAAQQALGDMSRYVEAERARRAQSATAAGLAGGVGGMFLKGLLTE